MARKSVSAPSLLSRGHQTEPRCSVASSRRHRSHIIAAPTAPCVPVVTPGAVRRELGFIASPATFCQLQRLLLASKWRASVSGHRG